jgi:hypothetical protein
MRADRDVPVGLGREPIVFLSTAVRLHLRTHGFQQNEGNVRVLAGQPTSQIAPSRNSTGNVFKGLAPVVA